MEANNVTYGKLQLRVGGYHQKENIRTINIIFCLFILLFYACLSISMGRVVYSFFFVRLFLQFQQNFAYSYIWEISVS